MNMNEKRKKKGEKSGLGLLTGLIAIGVATPLAAPFAIIFLILYLGECGTVFLILFILTILLYLLGIFLIIRYLNKRDSSSSRSADPFVTNDSVGSSNSSAFILGLMGGALLDRTLRKRKSSDNDFLWQEKIRRDMHDEGFTDW